MENNMLKKITGWLALSSLYIIAINPDGDFIEFLSVTILYLIAFWIGIKHE